MPRGFLVKRTNRAAPVSYRVRSAEEGQGFAEATPCLWAPGRSPSCYYGMAGSPCCAPSRSPDRPEGTPGRPVNSSSPVSAESFPSSSTLGRAAYMGSSCAPIQAAKRQPPPPPAAKARALGKRARAARRDEVTTSPVLGLRITEELVDCRLPKVAGQPLGGFVCQLCKEEYADALSLAQHRCSRIVRVEYRCSECDKVFSCPANLASHCRWHKPRKAGSPAGQDGGKSKDEGQQRESCDPSPRPPCCDDPGPAEDDLFDCPLCGKKFRRQAYLRKHLATHRPPVLLPGGRPFLRQPSAQRLDSAGVLSAGPLPQRGLRLALAAAEERPCPPETPYVPRPVPSRQDSSVCQPLERRQVVLLQLSTAHTVV